MNIGLAITGSFCIYNKIFEQIETLVKAGHNVTAIVTEEVKLIDTRFGNAQDYLDRLKSLTGKDVITNIVESEPLGPKNAIDVLVVAPCTGNTLSKLANGLSDDAVTMSAKAHMRNYKPLVIGISTNDALGLNLQNIAKLINEKNVFFVPFGQDNPTNKPKSMIAKWDLLLDTILEAVENRQIQPVILGE
ncbi:MAG: dipicolinate synthase subunit B [Clostridia bacterium]|nr:dipicolinate synthase subunit B [Clostridia bacterium]